MDRTHVCATEEVQRDWQLLCQQAGPCRTPVQESPSRSSTRLAIAFNGENGSLPNTYLTVAIPPTVNQCITSGPCSLAILISTSIPDPDSPVPPSHPLHSPATRCEDDTDSCTSESYVPNPPGQEGWVDRLVAVCPLEDQRQLQGSQRLRHERLIEDERRIIEERRVRDALAVEVECLLQAQRCRRRDGRGDHGPEEHGLREISRRQEEPEMAEERYVQEGLELAGEPSTMMQRLQMQAEIDRPWTCRCACLDENGKERAGETEWMCIPLMEGKFEAAERRGGRESTQNMSAPHTQQQAAIARGAWPVFQLPARANCAVPIVDPTTVGGLSVSVPNVSSRR